MSYSFIILAIYLAFNLLWAAAYFFDWAQDNSLLEPCSMERAQMVVIALGCQFVMIGAGILFVG